MQGKSARACPLIGHNAKIPAVTAPAVVDTRSCLEQSVSSTLASCMFSERPWESNSHPLPTLDEGRRLYRLVIPSFQIDWRPGKFLLFSAWREGCWELAPWLSRLGKVALAGGG